MRRSDRARFLPRRPTGERRIWDMCVCMCARATSCSFVLRQARPGALKYVSRMCVCECGSFAEMFAYGIPAERVSTGCRVRELHHLTRRQVDTEHNVLFRSYIRWRTTLQTRRVVYVQVYMTRVACGFVFRDIYIARDIRRAICVTCVCTLVRRTDENGGFGRVSLCDIAANYDDRERN